MTNLLQHLIMFQLIVSVIVVVNGQSNRIEEDEQYYDRVEHIGRSEIHQLNPKPIFEM